MARLLVVAPGRGSYNRTELGYLQRFPQFAAQRMALLEQADALRAQHGRVTISQLDGSPKYSSAKHLPGENASGLIFTCAAADFSMLVEKHEIVATLGNSMGWYTTLFTGGALSFADAFQVVDTMGWQQKDHIVGGQVIYPLVDDRWREVPGREDEIQEIMATIRQRGAAYWVGLSIRLGGLRVLAGTDLGIKALLESLPAVKLGQNEYPFQLAKHSAFHTELMRDASQKGFAALRDLGWQQPRVPMIDGNGYQWRPLQASINRLRQYTLGEQVVEPYDFTGSLRVGLREYNPDYVVLLGPGESMGGAIAQTMIAEGWRGLHERQDFIAAQKSAQPPLIAMNRPNQADLLLT